MMVEHYRNAVGMIVIDKDSGEVLLVRKKDSSYWSIPTGGVDEGENYEQTVCRELAEELGVQEWSVHSVKDLSLAHSFPWSQELVDRTGFQGQRQQMHEVVIDKESVDLEKALEDEIAEIKWYDAKDVFDAVSYEDLKETLTKCLS